MKQPLDQDQLEGNVERITFHSKESGFCVLKVRVRGNRKELVTVTGKIGSIFLSEEIVATGQWFFDKKYGKQFKADNICTKPPVNSDSIEKYLSSGLIKGIGPAYAKKLIKAFGQDVFEVIEKQPERLMNVEGIGKGRAEQIIKSWQAQKVIKDIMIFLQSHNITSNRAYRIYQTYGDKAIDMVRENPYRLATDIKGIGFLSSDSIAISVGIARESVFRVSAGIEFVLQKAAEFGHCGLPEVDVIENAHKLLEVDSALIENTLAEKLLNAELMMSPVDNTKCIFLKGYYYTEQGIAREISRLKFKHNDNIIDHLKAIEWVESQLNISLAKSQKDAIKMALSEKISVITGGPGVGKTTIINSIIKIMSQAKTKIILCAPTGRAAKRMSETTGMEAKTIHRLLGINMQSGEFVKNWDNHLDCDLLVIDETSMVDSRMMYGLLKSIPDKAKIIIVGDVDQLPSVGAGQVLRDIIDSEVIAVSKLTEIFRQAADSKIIQNAYLVNKGEMPSLENSNEIGDYYFKELEDGEVLPQVNSILKHTIPEFFKFNPVRDLQILCPTKNGIVGTINLNREIQTILNGNATHIMQYGGKYGIGDKVMQLVNNYDKDVFNGDIGYITTINEQESKLSVDYEGHIVEYDFQALDEIQLAYAVTIHKSQGSEYKAVIMIVSKQHYMLLQKNLIYTGMTRAKSLIIILGQSEAIKIAIKKNGLVKRWCRLREWIQHFNSTDQDQSI
jgi:exodeoxyribonuclease V alpha subunit